MPDLNLEANVVTSMRETITPKKFFITNLFIVHDQQLQFPITDILLM
jgi:hypothetical protein